MRSLMLLCAFCLFAIVQGQMRNPENFKNHYKCLTYMNCISDGPMARKMESCLDLLKPGDLKLILENIEENYYKFENHTVLGALSEYCNMGGDEQRDVYYKMVDGLQSLMNVVCVDKNMAGMCSRNQKCMACIYFYLKNNFPDAECKID